MNYVLVTNLKMPTTVDMQKGRSMIRKYHNHTLQTSLRHRKEEPQNNVCHKTSGRPINMIAKLGGHKELNNKTMTKHIIPRKQWEQQSTINPKHLFTFKDF